MGMIVEVQELTCAIPPTRLFKAYILDSYNLLPKIMPSVIKSIETTEGNGGAGSIKLITLCQGGQVRTLKHKIEELDETNHVYKYSEIEGGILDENFESASVAVKIEDGPNGGSIYKEITTYDTKGDNHKFIQEKIKEIKEAAKALFQAVEAHLLSNPNEYK